MNAFDIFTFSFLLSVFYFQFYLSTYRVLIQVMVTGTWPSLSTSWWPSHSFLILTSAPCLQRSYLKWKTMVKFADLQQWISTNTFPLQSISSFNQSVCTINHVEVGLYSLHIFITYICIVIILICKSVLIIQHFVQAGNLYELTASLHLEAQLLLNASCEPM